MDKSELDRRVEEEAGEARRRWYGREEGRAWKGLTETERSDWISVARPLVERIAELEGVAIRANEGGNDEIEKLNREIYCLRADLTEARDSGQAFSLMLTAAQTAGRDQASELEKLRGALADANETIKGADESRKGYVAEIQRLKLYVDALKSDLGVVRDSLTAAEREADRHQNRAQRLQHAVKALAAMVVDADRTRGQS